jgi:hypothetical protein
VQATSCLQSKAEVLREFAQLEESLTLAIESIPLHLSTAFEWRCSQKLQDLSSFHKLGNSPLDTTCVMQQLDKEYEGLTDEARRAHSAQSQTQFREDLLAAHSHICQVQSATLIPISYIRYGSFYEVVWAAQGLGYFWATKRPNISCELLGTSPTNC